MSTAPLSQLDTNSLYNAGFTAWVGKDYNAAKTHFEKCLAYNYYYNDGEVFAKLSDVYSNLGDKEASVAILEERFTKCPQNQSILIGLINYYLSNNQEPDKLLELISLAEENDSKNVSLWYVEGNIYKALDRLEEALKSYDKCVEINPEYEYGYIGPGVLFFEQAVKISEEASKEYDDVKYAALVEKFEKYLMDSIDPFEKAFDLTKDEGLKVSIAENLKSIYYRFYSKGAEYEEGYNKYNDFIKSAK